MPLKRYGVLKGIVQGPMKLGTGKPHLGVLITIPDASKDENNFCLAINIESQAKPSQVLYYVGEDFRSEHITELPKLPYGFTCINSYTREIALDYIRGNLLKPEKMLPLPPVKPGPDNDLYEKLTHYFKQAIPENEKAIVYAFGERWGPEKKADEYFDFKPSNGIHDIHMNQGNTEKWRGDDGIYQDGGILIHFEQQKRWVGIFLAFQSQSWCTDENGHRIKLCTHKEVKQPAMSI